VQSVVRNRPAGSLRILAAAGNAFYLRLNRHRIFTTAPQLAFNDATYVLHRYRHLFPCVPTSDAAWCVTLMPQTYIVFAFKMLHLSSSSSLCRLCFQSNSNNYFRYSLAVSYRADNASEVICLNSAFKCMSSRVKHMQVHSNSGYRHKQVTGSYFSDNFESQNLALAGMLTELHAQAYR
jgi:hypothetical protein